MKAMIKEKDILDLTHYGLNIYAHILREYYPGETVIQLSGKECKPAKNPFNDDKHTLKLINQEWVFNYNDTELPDFSGTPFDFAELHYKLSGGELREKLNKELNLRIDEKHFYSNRSLPDQAKTTEVKSEVQIPIFSYFNAPVKNINPKKNLRLIDVYYLIKSTEYSSITDQLRAIPGKGEARKFKASKFDYVTFSGTFSKRSDKALVNHSGLLTIDFDHISNLQQLKEQLLEDEYFETELLFVSPSGDGLKWIIPIDITEATHQNFFQAIANYIREAYQLEVDKSGKDVSRACFLPHDPEAYINPKYLNPKIKKDETK
ncbi:virulence protein E [Draconibacterium orientale]|uniref:Virulence protein E n=2 Tax=Draconibacterium orientale TaxID=1168034 RepID=A0ABN4D0B7_9BACT|nr:virulence protein E [Draconibacterium orientale]